MENSKLELLRENRDEVQAHCELSDLLFVRQGAAAEGAWRDAEEAAAMALTVSRIHVVVRVDEYWSNVQIIGNLRTLGDNQRVVLIPGG